MAIAVNAIKSYPIYLASEIWMTIIRGENPALITGDHFMGTQIIRSYFVNVFKTITSILLNKSCTMETWLV